MKIDKGNSGLNTSFGSMLTILVYGTIVLYTYLKIDVWITKKDVDIMSTKMMDSIGSDYIVSNDLTGLNVAIGFT